MNPAKLRMAIASSLTILCLASACKSGGKDDSVENAALNSSFPSALRSDTLSIFKIPPKYASAFSGYQSGWFHLTGYEYSGLHWGEFISLYVNKNPDTYVKNYFEYIHKYIDSDIDEENRSQDNEFKSYEVGTIFLKENYRAVSKKPSAPLTITAMIKKEKGYDSTTHDWQFLQFDTRGKILFDGNSHDAPTREMCIKCHGNMTERDLIFSTFCSWGPCRK